MKRAAGDLAADTAHYVGDERRAQIETTAKFATMTAEQLHAFRHATREQGLALIDERRVSFPESVAAPSSQ